MYKNAQPMHRNVRKVEVEEEEEENYLFYLQLSTIKSY